MATEYLEVVQIDDIARQPGRALLFEWPETSDDLLPCRVAIPQEWVTAAGIAFPVEPGLQSVLVSFRRQS